MADTLVKKLVDAAAAAIAANDPGKPAGLIVVASRIKSTAGSKDLKRIAVYPLADNPKQDNTPRNRTLLAVHRVLTLVVECRCAGTDLDNEVLRAWAIGQLMKDCTLGGLAVDLNEGTTGWDELQDSTTDVSQALVEILVDYARLKASLEPIGGN